MVAEPTRGWPKPTAEELALRSRYRCALCYKHCPIPCRFTAAEYRQLVEATLQTGPESTD